MIYAQIKNEEVYNKILIDDESKIPLFAQGFDGCIRVDNLKIIPDIGWYYRNGTFTNVVNFIVEGGIPKEVPSGTATNFEPFELSENSHEFIVSVDGENLRVGCAVYDYRWIRYALWEMSTKDIQVMGPLTKTNNVFTYRKRFKITQADVDLIYSALCTLKE